MALLLKLLLAHLLGDFTFQPTKWIKDKEQRRILSPYFYLHLIIHAVLIMLLIRERAFLVPCAIIIATHGLIDLSKLYFQTARSKRLWFVLDQFLHLLVILFVWGILVKPKINFEALFEVQNLALITALVFVTTPTSVIIKTMISKWTPGTTGPPEEDSLPEAGKFIGILERLFTLLFVLTNHLEAVGFLLTAKSVFRFGDLKEAHDRKLTEYVLIGTLLSFGIATITGEILKLFFTYESLPGLFKFL